MIEPDSWMRKVVPLLVDAFSERLVYVGLQGSYRRSEAGEGSDIDLVTVFESLDAGLLKRHGEIVRSMPEGDKACGFVAGRSVLAAWPRHEILSFRMDTRDYHGRLEALLPETDRADAVDAARIGAGNLYHLVAHAYTPSGALGRTQTLAAAYKGAFFVMQVIEYLRSGNYHTTRAELTRNLNGREKEIMAASSDFAAWSEEHSEEEATNLLLSWCGEIITKTTTALS